MTLFIAAPFQLSRICFPTNHADMHNERFFPLWTHPSQLCLSIQAVPISQAYCRQTVDFHQTYHGNCFTQQFFSLLINVDNWAVSPHAHPSSQFKAGSIPTLHILDFL
jgi:hypothetical protein